MLRCRDVAICFHVHCLSPFRFGNDVRINYKSMWEKGLSFPLERLHYLIEMGIWSDRTSGVAWNTEYPNSPYQVWTADPSMTGEQATLQEITLPKSFSLDLVAASLRQREFTNRIIHECNGINSPQDLQKAISRYHKFLRLMGKKNKITGKHTPLVPTLDVDLAWHTHQLFPHSYSEYCLQYVGRAINHDDTFEENVIGHGLRETSLAWLKEYDEPYTTKDLRKGYFTTKRKVIGVMFPPYGILMLRTGKKLMRARMSISLTSLIDNADGIVVEPTGQMRGNDRCGGGGISCQTSNCSGCGGSGGG
jgi:hypothetical protein